VIVGFAEIGGIVEHQYLNFLFATDLSIQISYS
jgi:hypothetical protein